MTASAIFAGAPVATRSRAPSAVFAGSPTALRTRAPSAILSATVSSGAPAESWSAPFAHGVATSPVNAYGNVWSFLADLTPGEAWSNIFEKTNLAVLSGQVTSGVHDHFAEVLNENVASGPFDHFAEQIAPEITSPVYDHFADEFIDGAVTSGPFDHEAEGIPGAITSAPFDHDAEATGRVASGIYDHDVIAVPDPFTPIDPNVANPPELKIRGLLEPRGCVGTGGGQSPGVCGTELGFENVIEET